MKVGALVGLVLLGWLVSHAAWAPRLPIAAFYWAPVVLASFWLRLPGTLALSAVAALLSGPLAPAQFAATALHGAWLVRVVFYLALGGVVSVMSGLVAERTVRVERAMESVKSMYARTLRGFMSLLELKDSETTAHCERVARNAVVLGESLGLRGNELDTLYWAGYLHDLGKLGTPARILLKPGSLTKEEYDEVKLHTEAGAKVLEEVSPAFHDIALGVRHHHERWDGKGYPHGLAGEDIPLFGRILAVVDVFEALTSVRPYRPAFLPKDAMSSLREGAGTQFDPAIVKVFLSLAAEGRLHHEGEPHTASERCPPLMFDPGQLVEDRDAIDQAAGRASVLN